MKNKENFLGNVIMKILGLDIGGANTDCTIIELKNNSENKMTWSFSYKFFIW